jgi:hypothetical protein
MSRLIEWFASPGLVDLVLVLTCAEAACLALWRRAGHGALSCRDVALLLLPGVFLMLALRAALAGATWPWVPVALGGALMTHVLDLRTRLRG